MGRFAQDTGNNGEKYQRDGEGLRNRGRGIFADAGKREDQDDEQRNHGVHIAGIPCRQAGMRGDGCALVAKLAEGIIRGGRADDQGDQLREDREDIEKNAKRDNRLQAVGDTGQIKRDGKKRGMRCVRNWNQRADDADLCERIGEANQHKNRDAVMRVFGHGAVGAIAGHCKGGGNG